jgi:pre-mRNA-splicing factor CWC22
MTWRVLLRSINGLVNKVNVSNIKSIVLDLFKQDLLRGRGVLVRSLMKAQLASPTFTRVYAAVVSVVNCKLPEIGELLLKRVLHQFRRAYTRNDKVTSTCAVRFIAHLVNQQVAHEIIALQIATLLLEEPTDDSVELTCTFMQECGFTLNDVTPQGLNAVFERLRGILHEGTIDKRVQCAGS